MECVARIASINDGAAGKVALITYLVPKLWHTWILTMRKFKTCERRENGSVTKLGSLLEHDSSFILEGCMCIFKPK